jgi:hypothetical protein
MATFPKVPNQDLAAAGLALMSQNGKQLERVEAKGRAMIYRTQHGKSVRVRTCNDHVLVVLADSADESAKLNVEGTDQILIVMPEVPRMRGNVLAYLVPTEVVVEAARTSHAEWLRSEPATKGQNRTWNLWFDNDGLAKSNGFGKKWAEYRLSGNSASASTMPSELPDHYGGQKLGDVIVDAKRRIAAAAGIPESAVKISIDLS